MLQALPDDRIQVVVGSGPWDVSRGAISDHAEHSGRSDLVVRPLLLGFHAHLRAVRFVRPSARQPLAGRDEARLDGPISLRAAYSRCTGRQPGLARSPAVAVHRPILRRHKSSLTPERTQSDLRVAGHKPARAVTAALVCLVAATVLDACTGHGPAPRQSAGSHTNSLGCYSGRFWLKADPNTVRDGQLVRLTTSGRWPVHDVTHDVITESYGMLGFAENHRFVNKYYLAAIAPGIQQNRNVPAAGSVALGGVGLPNQPFEVQIPPVHSGNYIIQFKYTILSQSTGPSAGPVSYNLCAEVNVR